MFLVIVKRTTASAGIETGSSEGRFDCISFPFKVKRKDKNPEEMNRLRDQLVGTFKEQMDIRLDGDFVYLSLTACDDLRERGCSD